MQCPFCKTDDDRVLDSRSIGDGTAIRRRRECQKCGKRFTTYERLEVSPRMVVKKSGERELFGRAKVLAGMIKACEKRNLSLEQLEGVASKIESELFEEYDSEVSSQIIGEKVGDALKELDHVAFVRFASVYREFTDVKQFFEELLPLVRNRLSREELESRGLAAGGAEASGAAAGSPHDSAGEPTDGDSPRNRQPRGDVARSRDPESDIAGNGGGSVLQRSDTMADPGAAAKFDPRELEPEAEPPRAQR